MPERRWHQHPGRPHPGHLDTQPFAGPGYLPGSNRFLRILIVAVLGFLAVPLAMAAVITATFAGWTSVAVAAILGVAIVVTGLLAGRFLFGSLRPVKELVSATGRLADGDYSARITAPAPRAMSPVVRSFNQMAHRLEESDDLRRRLLADVGHEIRTPLTIVRGQLEAMADGVRELNEQELRLLLEDVAAIERLLDDLRLLSTTEAEMVDLDRDDTNLDELTNQVAERFRRQADEHGVKLEVDVDPVTAFVDPYRLGQVVTNLIANALRAAVDGDEIVVTVRPVTLRGRPAGCVEVRDTGHGIPADRIDAVFDRFQKGEGSNGSGLGLTISRDLVVAHGGTIELRSELGVGTTVLVTVPA